MWNFKVQWIARTILKKNNVVEGLTPPDVKTYYKVMVFKTVWYWHEDMHIYQCTRIEIPEINPSIYTQMIFNMDVKTIQWEKFSLFNKWYCEN